MYQKLAQGKEKKTICRRICLSTNVRELCDLTTIRYAP